MCEKVDQQLIFRPERLKSLANYLRTRKRNSGFKVLEDDNWMFSEEEGAINVFPVFECVVKALPKVFPEEWKVTSKGLIHQTLDPRMCLLTSLVLHFGIDVDQFMHLFTPYAQEPDVYGGDFLERNATPRDIARNISELISYQQLALELHPDIPIFISKN